MANVTQRKCRKLFNEKTGILIEVCVYYSMKTVIKFNIEALKNFRIAEDGELYRMAITKNKRFYGTRKIKKQKDNSYKLNGKSYSALQLNDYKVVDNEPIEIFKQ